jgi:DNA-entry nuclease
MKKFRILAALVALCVCMSACASMSPTISSQPSVSNTDEIPEFAGDAYIILNSNIPDFTENDLVVESYESYSPLDALGRCGAAMACIGTDIMPTEERGSIGQVKPSGWHTVKYDHVDGKYLYNRCHLIGYQLTGENANEENLITGTRYLNVEGMLPFENMVADYVKETENHVLYRVTPVFEGDNLVADGVIMEAQSVEDNGDGIQFHVYVYNNQPGVEIDYATGESRRIDLVGNESEVSDVTYILNTNSRKIHRHDCGQVASIKQENKQTTSLTKEELISPGYSACKGCNP